MAGSNRVCVGAIAGAHGVSGRVRVKCFTENPADIDAYGPLSDEAGKRTFTLKVTGEAKDDVVRAQIDGVRSREDAEALKGLRLYVDRSALPDVAAEADDDEDGEAFYHADLIGLEAVFVDGDKAGEVRALYDFGAGDVVEIACPGGRLVMVPFTKATVPEVDVAGGRIVIDDAMGFFKEAEKPKNKPRRRSQKARVKSGGGQKGGE